MNDLYARRDRSGMSIGWQIASGISILIAVAIFAGAGGFWYARLSLSQAGEFRSGISPWETDADEIGLLNGNASRCESEISSISRKLGKFQAEILRINALGERLVEKAGLSHEEFDFQSMPPQGGPEPPQIFLESKDELVADMERLLAEMLDKGHKLSLLEQIIMETELHDEGEFFGRPVTAGYISSYFGYRKDPFHGRSTFHSGIDYAGKLGSPILVVADGVVAYKGNLSGFGKVVDVRHLNGLVSRYAHCHAILVNEGDLVQKGQKIATIGSTGRSTGPHLHFEVLKDDVNLNPLRFVSAKRIVDKD